MKNIFTFLLLISSIANAQYTVKGIMSPKIEKSDWIILYKLEGTKQIFVNNTSIKGDSIDINGKKELKPISTFAKKAFWHPVNKLPQLAFDHSTIFERALLKIKRKITYQPIAFELLPEKFTLTQLQTLYEAVLNKKLDKRNFRKKMLNYGILKELGEKQKGVSFRAANLYKFDKRTYAKLFKNELSF